MSGDSVFLAQLEIFKVIIADKKYIKNRSNIDICTELISHNVFVPPEAIPYLSEENIADIIRLHSENADPDEEPDFLHGMELDFADEYEGFENEQEYYDSATQTLYYEDYRSPRKMATLEAPYGASIRRYPVHGDWDGSPEWYSPNAEDRNSAEIISLSLTTPEDLSEPINSYLSKPKDYHAKYRYKSYSDKIVKLINKYNVPVNLQNIPEKDIRCQITIGTGNTPRDFDEFMRIIIYTITENTDITKDSNLNKGISALAESATERQRVERLFKKYISQHGYQQAAENSNRWRKTLLHIRRQLDDPKARAIINKITKLAKKRSIPCALPTINRIGDSDVTVEQLRRDIRQVPTNRLVQAHNTLRERLLLTRQGYTPRESVSTYRICNGNSFTKVAPVRQHPGANLEGKFEAIKHEIKSRFTDAQYAVYAPVDLAVPTTSRAFVGNVPVYTRLTLNKDFMVATVWDASCYATVHLRATTFNGTRLGRDTGGYPPEFGISYSGSVPEYSEQSFYIEYFNIGVAELFQPLIIAADGFSYRSPRSNGYSFIAAHDSGLAAENYTSVDDFQSMVLTVNNHHTRHKEILAVLIPHANETVELVYINADPSASYIPGRDITPLLLESFMRKTESAMTIREFCRIADIPHYADSTQVERARHNNPDLKVLDFSYRQLARGTFAELLGGALGG